MTIYGYQCRECGQHYDSDVQGATLWGEVTTFLNGQHMVKWRKVHCKECGNKTINRKYTISAKPIMHSHMNRSTGTMISDEAQFKATLKDMGERETERTGIPNNYEPIDPEEARQTVIDSGAAGLDGTNQKRVAEGRPAIRIKGVL
jgi:DNA-directed RNA polymerase subunit RPC12/RpoP